MIACPAGCATCSIPSFSPSASYGSLTCSACHDGYLLESGKCVKTCSDGFFLPPGTAEKNGTCQRKLILLLLERKADEQDVTTPVYSASHPLRLAPAAPTIPLHRPGNVCRPAHSNHSPSTVPASPARLHAVPAPTHSIVEHVLPAPPIDLFYTTRNASRTALDPCISTE